MSLTASGRQCSPDAAAVHLRRDFCPIEKVWSVVRQFNGLPAWHPVIASSSLDSGEEGQVGAVRRLITGDGGVIVERLPTRRS